MFNIADTPENRVSPEGRANFAEFLTSLSNRTIKSLKVLHVLRDASGFTCCDVNATGQTLEQLRMAVEFRLAAGTLQPSGHPAWWNFWCGDLLARGRGWFDGSARSSYFLVIRGVAQPGDAEALAGFLVIGEPR